MNNALLYFPSFCAVQSLYQGGRASRRPREVPEASWREDVPAIWSFWVPMQAAELSRRPRSGSPRADAALAAAPLDVLRAQFSRGPSRAVPAERADAVATACVGNERFCGIGVCSTSRMLVADTAGSQLMLQTST